MRIINNFTRVLHFLLFITGYFYEVDSLVNVQLIAPKAVNFGDTVVLMCKWTLESSETLYSVKWYRGSSEFFTYLPKEFPVTRLFPLPGINVDLFHSTSEKVVLRDAKKSFEGHYRCEVSADAPSFHTMFRSTFIHVVDLPPGKPKIKVEKDWYASGEFLKAVCTSPPADPPANLTWLLNGRNALEKPVILQRILPSPAVNIQIHPNTGEPSPVDENNYIIFSPWKARPFVENIQDGEIVPSSDTVVLPATRPSYSSIRVDVTEPSSIDELPNKVSSISQVSFIVGPEVFERGQLRLTCISTVHSVYKEQDELVINEERPKIGSVLSSASDFISASLLVGLFCPVVFNTIYWKIHQSYPG